MANAIDIISLAEAKAALNITASTWDTELATYVTAASQAIDRLCGPVITRTITGETHHGGRHSIWLRHTPVVTISSIVEYDGTVATTLAAETNTAKTANDYAIDLATGRVTRRQSNFASRFPIGMNNVVVTYTAGRGAAADDRFKLACSLILANIWRGEQGSGTVTFGAPFEEAPFGATFFIPNKARQMLVDDLRAPNVG
jgi:hypothetical protein